MWVTVVLDPRSAEPRALLGNQVRARGSGVHAGIWRDLGEGPLLVQPPKAQSSSGLSRRCRVGSGEPGRSCCQVICS